MAYLTALILITSSYAAFEFLFKFNEVMLYGLSRVVGRPCTGAELQTGFAGLEHAKLLPEEDCVGGV